MATFYLDCLIQEGKPVPTEEREEAGFYLRVKLPPCPPPRPLPLTRPLTTPCPGSRIAAGVGSEPGGLGSRTGLRGRRFDDVKGGRD